VPDLAPFHRDFVFLHILGVFVFLLAHGVSAGVMFRVRAESDPRALRALLTLSERSLNVMFGGALAFFIFGILAGFSGNFWTTPGGLWIWASLILVVVVFLLMTPLARFPLNRVREAVGDGAEESPGPDAAAIANAQARVQPMVVASMGVGGVAVLTWLMMYKPF
jgi:hypothetical protein